MTQKKTKKINKKETTKEKEESWLNPRVFFLLAIIFLVAEILGLMVANALIAQNLVQPMFGEDVNDIWSAIYLFGTILSMTIVILLILKFRKKANFLWFIEAMAVLTTSMIVVGVLMPAQIANVIPFYDLIAAIAIVAWRYTHRKSVFFRNVVSIIAIAGAGSLIGVSLGLLPIALFIAILSVYDIIAVFGTKHMVTIGKAVTKRNFAFTVSLPSKKHTFELGNGDLVIPLITASSIIAYGPFVNNYLIASLCLAASFIGLVISIYTVSVKKIPMPALPPQTLLMLAVIGAAMMLGL